MRKRERERVLRLQESQRVRGSAQQPPPGCDHVSMCVRVIKPLFMHACACVCVCACVCMHWLVFVCACVYACAPVCVQAAVCACVCVCLCACAHVYVRVCVR